MAQFRYIAKDSTGSIIKGTQDAVSSKEAYNLLRSRGIVPVEIIDNSGINKEFSINLSFLDKVKVKDLAVFCRQFSTILGAGVPMVTSLDILRKQTTNKILKSTLDKVYEDIQKGISLSAAFREHKKIFPNMLINMIEAGEVSGNLDKSLAKVAVHFEKEFKINQKVKGAMTYPLIVSVICLIVVIVLLTFVVPSFSAMFKDFGAELPMPTKILIAVGDFMKNYWYLVIGGLIGFFIGIGYFLKTPVGKRLFDELSLKLPIISGITRKVLSTKFCRTTSTMILSGVSLLASIDVVEKVMDNEVARDGMRKIKETISKGGGLAAPIESLGLFPSMVPQMVSIGEETGALADMLEKTADFYDEEVDAAISAAMTLIEPLVIVVMSIIVGSIVISIVMPMFSIIGEIK